MLIAWLFLPLLTLPERGVNNFCMEGSEIEKQQGSRASSCGGVL